MRIQNPHIPFVTGLAAIWDIDRWKTSNFAGAVCLACCCISGQRVDDLVDHDDVRILLAEGSLRSEDWPY